MTVIVWLWPFKVEDHQESKHQRQHIRHLKQPINPNLILCLPDVVSRIVINILMFKNQIENYEIFKDRLEIGFKEKFKHNAMIYCSYVLKCWNMCKLTKSYGMCRLYF